MSGCDKADPSTQTQQYSAQGSLDADIDESGHFAIIATVDAGTQYWNLDANQMLFIFTHQKNEKSTHRLVKLAQQAPIAITLDDHAIGVWDTQSGESKAFWALENTPLAVSLSQDGRFALIGFAKNEAKLIDLRTGLSWRTFEHADKVNSVDLSKNEQYALIGSEDSAVRLWDLNQGTLKRQWLFPFGIDHVALSSDNHYALISSSLNKTEIRDAQTGELVSELKLPLSKMPFSKETTLTITSSTFSKRDNILYTGSPPNYIREWDIKSGQLIHEWALPKHKGFAKNIAIPIAIAIKADGSLLSQATNGRGYSIQVQP